MQILHPIQVDFYQLMQTFLFHYQANITRTNHIMWTMGTDFKYQYARTWFRQLDKFIHYVNMVSRKTKG